MSAVLAAEWVGGLCLVAAWVVGWCTLAGGHTWTAVFTGPFLPWLLPGRVSGMGRSCTSTDRATTSRIALPKLGRAAVVFGVTVVLALVFGGLFTAADPAFAHLVDNLVPEFDGGDIVARLVVAGIVVAFVLEGGYLIRFRPRLDDMAPAPMRPVPRWEWALPLGVLDALFIAFVAVQASILFGGHTHVLETEGLTYAEYARQGLLATAVGFRSDDAGIEWRHPGGGASHRGRSPTAAGARRNSLRHIGCGGDLGDPSDVGVPAGIRIQYRAADGDHH